MVSTSNPARSPATKPATSPTSEMLTPSELESLRQRARENNAYFKEAFTHLAPESPQTRQRPSSRPGPLGRP
jgi:hypothetical protein